MHSVAANSRLPLLVFALVTLLSTKSSASPIYFESVDMRITTSTGEGVSKSIMISGAEYIFTPWNDDYYTALHILSRDDLPAYSHCTLASSWPGHKIEVVIEPDMTSVRIDPPAKAEQLTIRCSPTPGEEDDTVDQVAIIVETLSPEPEEDL